MSRIMQPLRLSVFALIVSVCTFASAPAFAEAKIAIVNIQQIMSESKAAQSIQKQLETQRKSFQEEFSQHERKLMEQEKALVEERATLPAEEFAAKRQKFENQLLDTRKLVQKRQRALEQAAGEALSKVRDKMVGIVSDMAAADGYDLVLTKQNVILSQTNLDITESVMKKLDKEMKEVKLDISTN